MSPSACDTRHILVLSGLLFAWLTVGTLAVDPALPSKTSVLTASLRAIGAKNPDAPFRNSDYLAIKFLGPRERALVEDFPMEALDLDFRKAVERLTPPGSGLGDHDAHSDEASRRGAR